MAKWQKTANIADPLNKLQLLIIRLKRLEAAQQLKRAEALYDFYKAQVDKKG